ncbi:MAG TPA: D-cysteine desulfhydrase family protein [Planctomycetota bacterium]|jgi:D-cysteine desulfhydrase|nr:D-cysteine desulfhydrase family protein [Planctomycetota bacterium]
MEIAYPRAVPLALVPTPIERLERASRALPVRVWVKRDDLTGCALSGNKVRKLEFLLAEALGGGADAVVTCGGLQSNHARATAIACARLGLRCRLLLRGSPDAPLEGNYLLDRFVGAEVRFLSMEEWRGLDALFEEECGRIRAAGGRPYLVPEGGSNALGSLGYARAVEEIARWSKETGVVFHSIVHATGSGGTTAGILLGCAAIGYSAEPVGVAVCDDEAFFRNRVDAIFEEARTRFAPRASRRSYAIAEGYKGRGYGMTSPEELEDLRRVAREEGLILDPVYTGKAFRGLLGEVRGGRFPAGSDVLFLHTGGIFGLLAMGRKVAGSPKA